MAADDQTANLAEMQFKTLPLLKIRKHELVKPTASTPASDVAAVD